MSHIIKRGDSFIFRTDECSFHSPTGTQAVIRYSESKAEALVVVHRFRDAQAMNLALDGEYRIVEKLYADDTTIAGNAIHIAPGEDFTGNVYYLSTDENRA